jgi:hypothetical protein
VERFSFSSDVAFVPRGDLLDRVTVAPLTPSIVQPARLTLPLLDPQVARVALTVPLRQIRCATRLESLVTDRA